MSHVLQILLTVNAHVKTCVLFKRTFTARDRCQPHIACPIQKIDQHLFVVTAQADHTFGVVVRHFKNVLHASRRIGATVDQVPEKDERVRIGIARQHIKQVEKLSAASVNIAYDKGFHSAWSPVCSRFLVLILSINSMKRGSWCMSDQLGSDSNHGTFSLPKPIAVSSHLSASTWRPWSRYADASQ